MAHNISLATYTVEVHPLRKSEATYLKFQEGDSGASVRSAILAQLQKMAIDGVNHADEKRLIKVTQLVSDASDMWGLLERGEYGAEAPIRNADTFAQTHLQSTKEAVMNRLYFRFHLPDGAKKGLLLMQRTGPIGAYTELRRVLEERFRKAYDTHRLRFARAVHPDILKEVLAGKVYELKIVTYKPSADLVNYIKGKGAAKNMGTITITATAQPDKAFWDSDSTPAWYKKVLTSNKSITELFPDDNFKSFRLTTDYKGQQRSFDLTKPEDIFPYQRVSDDVKIAADGHPDFDSIDAEAITIRDDLAVRIGITPENDK